MKSPAKRLSPVQSAATQTAPVWTASIVRTFQVGTGLSALKDSAQTTDQVEVVNDTGSPLSVCKNRSRPHGAGRPLLPS